MGDDTFIDRAARRMRATERAREILALQNDSLLALKPRPPRHFCCLSRTRGTTMTGKLKASMVHHPGCRDTSMARVLCDCGANVQCSSCGWGTGAWPCKCMREGLAARSPSRTERGNG